MQNRRLDIILARLSLENLTLQEKLQTALNKNDVDITEQSERVEHLIRELAISNLSLTTLKELITINKD